MTRTALSSGRKLAVVLAVLAILLGAVAVLVDLVQGDGFNPRPLGAVVIGLIVIASVRSKTTSA